MRTFFSRVLLIGLLGVAVYAVVSFASDPSQALAALDRISADDLHHDAFALDAPAAVAIDAAGSYEEAGSPGTDTTLAAYGWIVRREDGAVVWRMRPPRPARGTLVAVQDTVRLDAGTYDVYFASYGDPLVRDPGPRDGSIGERVRAFLSQGGRAWVGDAGRWRMMVFPVDPGRRVARTSGLGDALDRDDASGLVVWEARGVRDRQRREGILHVTAPARVALRAVTEIRDGAPADVAALVRLGTGDTVWTARGPGTWAGGSVKNRVVEGAVDLAPGVYRASFETDRSHAYDDWVANPPDDPTAWGLVVRRETADAAVGPLDPDTIDLPRIAGFDCVGPDQERRVVVTFPTATDVLLVAVGEVIDGREYDFATLERSEGDGDWDEVYEMEGRLEWAGGAEKNRRAVEALSLAAGTYRLTYEADGSHDCESGYNSGGGPDVPLWGARLFALDPALDLATLQVREVQTAPRPDPDDGRAAPLALPDAARLIARIDSVRDSEDRRVRFTLDAPTTVRVVAQGEISDDSRYDYATIERHDGQVVWEMKRGNTRTGDGSSSMHRRFDGDVSLRAGTYVLRYRTDGSRSFGDFGPSSRVLWGVHVYRPAAPTPAPAPPAPPPPPVPAPVDAD